MLLYLVGEVNLITPINPYVFAPVQDTLWCPLGRGKEKEFVGHKSGFTFTGGYSTLVVLTNLDKHLGLFTTVGLVFTVHTH